MATAETRKVLLGWVTHNQLLASLGRLEAEAKKDWFDLITQETHATGF